jgi:hypothetical protein
MGTRALEDASEGRARALLGEQTLHHRGYRVRREEKLRRVDDDQDGWGIGGGDRRRTKR